MRSKILSGVVISIDSSDEGGSSERKVEVPSISKATTTNGTARRPTPSSCNKHHHWGGNIVEEPVETKEWPKSRKLEN